MSKRPTRVKHRNKVLAKVYRPCQGRDSYRVTWYAAGQRQMKSFPTYSGPGGAKQCGEGLVVELAKNSQAAMLKPAQATDGRAPQSANVPWPAWMTGPGRITRGSGCGRNMGWGRDQLPAEARTSTAP